MDTVAAQKTLTDFETIADGFYDRVREGPRDLTRIAEITQIPYNTRTHNPGTSSLHTLKVFRSKIQCCAADFDKHSGTG
jgi:hypothetical protein